MESSSKQQKRNNRLAAIRSSLAANPIITATAKRLQLKIERNQKRKSSIQIQEKEHYQICSLQISSDGNDKQKSLFHDKYELGEKMGQGAHGIVKKCVDKLSKQICAVKILTFQREHVLLFKKNFIDIKALQHPHILTYKALFFQHSRCYLVMDYLPFPSLEQIEIDSEDEFKRIIFQMLITLRYIHQKKICHRDIKPENILYDKDKQSIKLIDFGISKKVEERGRKRDMLTPTGTPFYRAPQILEGGGYDQMVDMWALGVTMFKMMTGQTPFQSEYHIDTISNILKAELNFPSKFKFECSQAPKNLVRRLMRKCHKERLRAEDALKDVWFMDIKKQQEPANDLCQSFTFDKFEHSLGGNHTIHFNYSHDPSPGKSKQKKEFEDGFRSTLEETECSIFEMLQESEVKDLPSPLTPQSK